MGTTYVRSEFQHLSLLAYDGFVIIWSSRVRNEGNPVSYPRQKCDLSLKNVLQIFPALFSGLGSN